MRDFFAEEEETRPTKDFFADDKDKDPIAKDFFADTTKPQGKETPEGIDYGYGLRQDKTQKGLGFFGEIPIKKGVMTELGSESDVDFGQGQERLHYPLIVPTLSFDEIEHLKGGNEPTEEIWNKAIEHALERKKQGLSPFATQEEEGKTSIPKTETQLDLEKVHPMLQAYYVQAKAFSPEGLKGVERGLKSQLSGATFGLSERIPGMKPEAPKDEADEILGASNRFIGSMLPWSAFEKYVVGPIGEKVAWKTAKSTMSIMKPLLAKLATKMTVRGVAAPAIATLEGLAKNGEIPSKEELVKHGVWVAALGGAFDSIAEIGIPLHKALSNISKSEGVSLWDIYKRFGQSLKNKGYSFFKGEGKPVTPEAMKETGIEFLKKSEYPIEEVKEVEFKPEIDKPVVPPKIEIEKPAAPEKPKQKIYRGYDREEKGKVYTGTAEPILGEGKYFSFTEEGAKQYGSKIEKKELDLKNPLVINSDEQWKKLTKEAGWKYPNITGLPKEVIKSNISKMNQLIKSKGYDGVIVNWDDSIKGDMDKQGRGIKTLRNVFDIPQVFEFPKPEEKKLPVIVKLPIVKVEPPPPTPPSGDDPADPDKLTTETSKYFSKIGSKLNVEYPFQKIGANETGFAVKNYFDQINKHIDQGKVVAKEIKGLGLSKEQLNNVVLQSESSTPPKDSTEKKAWLMIRSYFDKSLEALKEQGVLKKGFHERIASQLLSEIKALDDLIKISKGNNKLKLMKQAKDLTEQLKEISKLRFVSIPVRALFESKVKSDPALTKRAIKFLNKKVRKTITLQDLVDSGLVDKKDLTPEMIISNYSRKYGRDIALAKIIKAAKKEGLATIEPKEGYVKIPGYIAPELSKYYINPVFADFIQGYTSPKTFNAWEKTSSLLKGWSFYNPIILPANDMWQQVWAVVGQPQNWLKLPGSWKQAFKDIIKKTPNFWEAYDNGLFSSPFVELEKNIKSFTLNVKESGPSPFLDILKKIIKYPAELHNKIYNAMGIVAWNADKTIRLATYNWLRTQGLSAREAAQTAALYHGDYARVPPATRRKLNKFLYTPTFKLVMGAALKENFKNVYKVVTAILKGEKINPDERARASGLIGIAVVLGAGHLLMKSMGWESEIPCLRYKKDIIDEDGKKKTIHMSFSLPFTLYWKFANRAIEATSKPGIENRLMKFLRSMKYETGVPVQIIWELMENKNRQWKEIYSPRAPLYEQVYQVMSYMAKRVFPIIGSKTGEAFRDPKEQAKVEYELGTVVNSLPFLFPYITERTEVINSRKVKYLMGKMNSLAKKGKLTEREKQNFLKEIEQLKKKK